MTSDCSRAPVSDHSRCAAQVHEEVLRLLLAVAKQLSPEQLGRYLQTTIQRSRKSRRHVAQASARVPGSVMQAAFVHAHRITRASAAPQPSLEDITPSPL